MEVTRSFYAPNFETIKLISKENTEIAKLLQPIDEVVAVIGTGFPYYAVDQSGNPIPVTEINDFLNNVVRLVSNDQEMNPEGWKCPNCQHENNLPDLKTHCKPCTQVELKPRDLFKALPDLDITVIAKNPSLWTEKTIQELLKNEGYVQTDTAIGTTVINTADRLENVQNGHGQKTKLPIDLHIWSSSEFQSRLDGIGTNSKQVLIPTRSLHTKWEDDEMDLQFDFLFSLTPISATAEIKQLINTTRVKLSEIPIEQLISAVSTPSARATRLMACPEVRQVFIDRIQSWKNHEQVH
jgi:hypothetical protein